MPVTLVTLVIVVAQMQQELAQEIQTILMQATLGTQVIVEAQMQQELVQEKQTILMPATQETPATVVARMQQELETQTILVQATQTRQTPAEAMRIQPRKPINLVLLKQTHLLILQKVNRELRQPHKNLQLIQMQKERKIPKQ